MTWISKLKYTEQTTRCYVAVIYMQLIAPCDNEIDKKSIGLLERTSS